MTKEDLSILTAAHDLIWTQGLHHPKHAAIALRFTGLLERLTKPKPRKAPLKKVEA